jgi:type VI secretion system secreted protein VgrG
VPDSDAGRPEAAATASENALLYGGRENDATGLLYYRARYYDPKLQRFISEDPLGLAGGIDLYTYTLNDPITFVDPFGLAACSCGKGRSSLIPFNPAKGAVALANAANAGRLYTTGALKLATAAGLTATPVTAPAAAGLAAWGLWNVKSAYAAQQRGVQQWNEALSECLEDASYRNLLGVAPFGQNFDDPGEPTPREFFTERLRNSRLGELLTEIGTAAP